MKKIVIGILFLMSLLFAVSASAQSVSINGHELQFSEETGIPYINENSRTMVPVRIVGEAMGANVTWDESEQKVSIKKSRDIIELFVGKNIILKNGVSGKMDTAVVNKDGRTYLPIRYVAQAMDCKVIWFPYRSQAVVMDKSYFDKYTKFRDMFEFEHSTAINSQGVQRVSAVANKSVTLSEFKALWDSLDDEQKANMFTMITFEKHQEYPDFHLSAFYIYKDAAGNFHYLASASTFSYDVTILEPFE